MIKRFEKTYGRYVLNVNGSDRYAYAHSDSSDLYDLNEFKSYYPDKISFKFEDEHESVFDRTFLYLL